MYEGIERYFSNISKLRKIFKNSERNISDSNDKLAQTSKLLEVLNSTSTSLATENLKQELAGN
jgi:hypothetical protein